MYSAPPEDEPADEESAPIQGETTDELSDEPLTGTDERTASETQSPDPKTITPGSDTNWTGNVPADD